MNKKYIYLILISTTLSVVISSYIIWNNPQFLPNQVHSEIGAKIVQEKVRSFYGSGSMEYGFSNGKYKISFSATKNSIVESRHAGDKIPSTSEMRDFLSTTSYQQSTVRIHGFMPTCNYEVFTGTYLSDPYCQVKYGKCSYSKEDIKKLSDQEIIDAYNGKGIRAKIWDTNYAPYPNFSILIRYYDPCFPIPSISYTRKDLRSVDLYIYDNKEAQKNISSWKQWAEGWEMIGLTIDGYKQYVYMSAIGSHYYYIELDDGDILSTEGGYFPDIRIEHVDTISQKNPEFNRDFFNYIFLIFAI